MPKNKITKQEQLHLRVKAKNEVETLEAILSNSATVKILDEFKNKFNICETVYKIVLAEHQRRKGKNDKCLKLDMRQVPDALLFAGYNFDRDLLNELFGSKSTKGKTAKKLRDAVTHGIDSKAVAEIVSRNVELNAYMDEFLNVIKTFDEIKTSN